MENRYENIPLSVKTREDMTLSVGDIKHIQRALSIQDEYFEEQIEKMENRIIESLASVLSDYNKNILDKLESIQADIAHIKDDIKEIKNDVVDIYKEIHDLQKRVTKLEKQIITLEKKVG